MHVEQENRSRIIVLVGLLAVCLLTYLILMRPRVNPDLADVRGVITLDGHPLPNAFVLYTPTEKGATSFGKTDSKGFYRMRFSDTEAGGAFIGTNQVRIGTGDVKADNTGSIPEVVPRIYNNETTLVVEVAPGNNTFDFDLKSDAGKIDQVEVDSAE